MSQPSSPLIVILTGAGISKESGLDTFRDKDGAWNRHRLEDVATPEGFARNPALVHEFYNARRRQLFDPSVAPNAAHLALARLEADYPGRVLLITQNIDDLHERAGSRALIHMHGELLKARCEACGDLYHQTTDLSVESVCSSCDAVGRMRPHIVWFGEMPFDIERIGQALRECEIFLSIGTSGNVYPAAGFVREANAAGARTIELNLEPSQGHGLFEEAIYGPASVVVPEMVRRLLMP